MGDNLRVVLDTNLVVSCNADLTAGGDAGNIPKVWAGGAGPEY